MGQLAVGISPRQGDSLLIIALLVSVDAQRQVHSDLKRVIQWDVRRRKAQQQSRAQHIHDAKEERNLAEQHRSGRVLSGDNNRARNTPCPVV